MNLEIVQNDMDTPFVTICMTQRIHQVDEESACLSQTLDPNQTARSGIECPRQVTFLILPRRHDLLLLSLKHPVVADFWVEMDINFVLIQQNLVRRQVVAQSRDFV